MSEFPVPKVSEDDAADRAARVLLMLGGTLMVLVLGFMAWLLIARPAGGFRFGFGPEVYLFVLGVGLKYRRRWAHTRSRKVLRWLLIFGGLGIPWNIGFAVLVVPMRTLAFAGAALSAVALLSGLELRRWLPRVDSTGSTWTDAKTIPRWSMVLIGAYVAAALVSMVAVMGALFR
jgi:cytochrome bd-type quinol oxidase subunit 2